MKDTKELLDSALKCISNGNSNVGLAYATVFLACELQNIKEQLREHFSIMINQQDQLLRLYKGEDIVKEEKWEQLEFDFNKEK